MKRALILLSVIIVTGFLLPQKMIIPVENATSKDWNPKSFWYYPWGKSVTHKGVDIFSKEGTPVLASTNGWVFSAGQIGMGGNYIVILGPKWRFHYYAHLKEIKVKKFHFVKKGKEIATVGTSGNAAGKPPHLHYAMVTFFPYFWEIDKAPQGARKMFYLDPVKYFPK